MNETKSKVAAALVRVRSLGGALLGAGLACAACGSGDSSPKVDDAPDATADGGASSSADGGSRDLTDGSSGSSSDGGHPDGTAPDGGGDDDGGTVDSGLDDDGGDAGKSTDGGGVSGAFGALHTYYLSPTGSDSNDGTSASKPWLSPKHAVDCGDVIIAAAGSYASANFGARGNWGQVSSCPSTSGGIDGKGGVYVANLLCAGPDVGSCAVTGDANASGAMLVDSSNWAVTGWKATALKSVYGSCFVATPSGDETIHHVAFVNDIADGCVGSGFQSTGYYGNSSYAVDQFAVVGSIATNASRGTSECYSGLSVAGPANFDTSAGTHVFVAGLFSFANVNGYCGANVSSGGFTTATATVSSGSTIQVASASSFAVGMPIGDIGAANGPGLSTGAIAAGTVIASISGTTIGLSKPLAGTVTSSEAISAGDTTDGEGAIFDTWDVNPYTGQGVIEQSAFWANGSSAIEVYNERTSTPAPNIYLLNNSAYGDLQDSKHQGSAPSEFLVQNVVAPLVATGNLIQASEQTPGGVPRNANVDTGGTVYAGVVGGAGASTTIASNFFLGLAKACVDGGSCDSGDSVDAFNGFVFGSNTYQAPGFANGAALPKTMPSCAGHPTSTACMLASGVADDLAPSGGAVGKGYQRPGACTADPYFPTWLKGAVGLSAGTQGLIYTSSSLITAPCGM